MHAILLTSLMVVVQAKGDAVRSELWCTLEPAAKRMTIKTVVEVPPGTKEFYLSELMGPVESSAPIEEVKSNDKARHWRFKGDPPSRVTLSYTSVGSQGFVYNLDEEACFAGGYNTVWYPQFNGKRSVGAMHFTVPQGYVVAASGRRSGHETTGSAARFDFEVREPAMLTFSAARYVVERIDGPLPVTVYMLRPRPSAKSYADGCHQVLKVLVDEFGPYPFPEFSIIETPDEQSHAAGFAGASFEGFMFADSNSLSSPFNLAYFGHEMGHQWWGNLIHRIGPRGSYVMSESLAQYGSLQCVDRIQGPAMSAIYRTKGYPSYSSRQCARGGLMYGPTGLDLPLANLPEGYDPAYHQLANAKGFLAFDSLARQVGRERFRKALRAVAAKYAWRAVTFDQMMDEVVSAAGRDARPLIQQWFFRTGAPTVWATWSQAGRKASIFVHQKAPAYDLALPVVAHLGNGARLVRTVHLSGLSASVEIQTDHPVTKVEVDPEWTLYHSTPELDELALQMKEATLGSYAVMRGKEEEARQHYEAGLDALPSADRFGVEFALLTGLAGYHRRAERWSEAKVLYERAIACAVRNEDDLPYTYLRLAQIADKQNDEARLRWALGQLDAADRALAFPSGAQTDAALLRAKRR